LKQGVLKSTVVRERVENEPIEKPNLIKRMQPTSRAARVNETLLGYFWIVFQAL